MSKIELEFERYAEYVESFKDEAIQTLKELDKIPPASWTERDFSSHAFATNTLNEFIARAAA